MELDNRCITSPVKDRMRKYKNIIIVDVVLHVIDMTAAINEKLEQFLNEGKPWEKKATSIPGVFLFKLPTFKGTSSLAIEINSVSPSTGAVTKRRGIIIRYGPELEEITRLLSNPKVAQLAKYIEEVNPQREDATAKSSNDIFEV